MSTKSTIKYGKTFHFYHECFDNDHVYLRLEGTHFEAGYNHVMVPIPIHIWEVIRHHGGADLSLASASDAELESLAEKYVDELIERYEQSPEGSVIRTICWGADRPRDEQIAEHRARFADKRKEQQEIAAAIEEVNTYDPRKDWVAR